MGDFGAKVSRRGYDINTAKDYQQNYNSGFPMIPIVATGTFSQANNSAATIATHSLGFSPMFVILHDDTATGSFGNGAVGESHMINNFLNNLFEMNDSILSHNGLGGASTTVGRYYIFGIDLEQSFTAPIVNSGTNDEVNEDAKSYGIKVAKEGKDVSSDDLRDFTIHSGTRAPLIHSVTYGTHTAATTETIDHNLGYIPFPFYYWKSQSVGKWIHVPNQSVGVTTTQATVFNNAAGTGDEYALVLLKEPLAVN